MVSCSRYNVVIRWMFFLRWNKNFFYMLQVWLSVNFTVITCDSVLQSNFESFHIFHLLCIYKQAYNNVSFEYLLSMLGVAIVVLMLYFRVYSVFSQTNLWQGCNSRTVGQIGDYHCVVQASKNYNVRARKIGRVILLCVHVGHVIKSGT